MNRRGFLSLLVATPLVPALAKLSELRLEPERELELAGVGDRDELAELVGNSDFIAPRFTRERLERMARSAPNVRRAVLPFAPDHGFDPVIEAGSIGRLIAIPQRPFRADRLVTLEGFDILGLSVHGEPVLEESLPSDYFLPTSSYAGSLGFHMTDPGDVIVMVVRNRGASRRFGSSLVGTCVT